MLQDDDNDFESEDSEAEQQLGKQTGAVVNKLKATLEGEGGFIIILILLFSLCCF